nr:MAG TPA: hypothetical protein [Caudoviricetes sp.]
MFCIIMQILCRICKKKTRQKQHDKRGVLL